MTTQRQAPPIADYALLGDCRGAALVSRDGSIDWCCLPRFDAEPCFGRLLDWGNGGHWSIAPTVGECALSRTYVEGTLVLCTSFDTGTGRARLFDFMTVPSDSSSAELFPQRVIRIVEGIEGSIDFEMHLLPRFNFGDLKPWIRRHDEGLFTAVGGDHGLVIAGDTGIGQPDKYTLHARFRLQAGERKRFMVEFRAPAVLDDGPGSSLTAEEFDRSLDDTLRWWKKWSAKVHAEDEGQAVGVGRSALVLKALSFAPTGAIIAAPTTSLPEGLQGTRTWDYRLSWVRDASFTADALIDLGCEEEAFRFRRFVERSSAGSAQQVQTLYGIDGARRLSEFTLDHLPGYRGAAPVRVGNQAAHQIQLDVLGEMLELSWIWHRHGHSPDDEYWQFLVELVDRVSVHWSDADHGIWEMRGEPQHYVYSKVMCWSALNRGIALAQELHREVPVKRWARAREQVRKAVEHKGYNPQRGIFIQAFERDYLDAALLRLPLTGFIDYDDERMLRTVEAIRAGLDADGLLRRYDSPDDLPGPEGAFLPCSFWLTECLVGQGRLEEARQVFDRTVATANDLGLFSEQYDFQRNQLLANFPLGLTHLSHISAALALQRCAAVPERRPAQNASH